MIIEDLDVLRPEPRIIRLNGKDIDVSFIPCAITFDVDRILNELNALNRDEVLQNGEAARRGFDLAVQLCSTFCQHQHPEMDEEWFKTNTSPQQVGVFSNAIKQALIKSYDTGSASGKRKVTKKR